MNTNPVWRKATKSGSNGGQCVEVARLDDGTIGVRYSKNPNGPVLRFSQAEWEAFLDGMVKREFDQI